MTTLNRRRFFGVASTAGVAVTTSQGVAVASGGDERNPHLIGVQADSGASVIAQNFLDPRTVDITIDSVALGHTASVRIILPNRFGSRAGASWPVLYLLHGGYGDYTDWARHSDVARLVRKRDVLVVMPDGGALGFYTDWWARGAGSKPGWETFHLVELSQILARGLHAANRRAIAGLSMGGFGAMSYAARHPGFFRAAASFSGTLDTLHPTAEPVSSDPFAMWFLQTHIAPNGYDPLSLFGDPTAQHAIWAAHNPADLVKDLRGTKLFVSCGNGRIGPLDPPGTDPSDISVRYEAVQLRQNQEFVKRATHLGLDVTFETCTGSHTWPYWARELEKAFPLLMRAIEAG
ncbi:MULTISPECIES: alpha/beta hydrolase [Streptomyces violaceusniger group]|uniref:Acyl-CoA:diacylglycerol acyltransferase n=2 Tax=Streptomyces javensis TaxID=114698 RepID=A0ABS0R3N4_9ACTN|nr:alpha/beta hydrolase family protein [Streptomyces javensis]MBI0311491.1 prolyl oligopeptidase family serine peptidase [Streptomyces javensis]